MQIHQSTCPEELSRILQYAQNPWPLINFIKCTKCTWDYYKKKKKQMAFAPDIDFLCFICKCLMSLFLKVSFLYSISLHEPDTVCAVQCSESSSCVLSVFFFIFRRCRSIRCTRWSSDLSSEAMTCLWPIMPNRLLWMRRGGFNDTRFT